jgi:hypothetical protein
MRKCNITESEVWAPHTDHIQTTETKNDHRQGGNERRLCKLTESEVLAPQTDHRHLKTTTDRVETIGGIVNGQNLNFGHHRQTTDT